MMKMIVKVKVFFFVFKIFEKVQFLIYLYAFVHVSVELSDRDTTLILIRELREGL